MWKKIAHTTEFMSYEHEQGQVRVYIEARQDETKRWTIFKTYRTAQTTSCSEEYSAESKEDAEALIQRLMKEKVPSAEQINELQKLSHQRYLIKAFRAYKEPESEKWFFTVDQEKIPNILIVRYADRIEIDIVMHEKYKPLEKKILREITDILGTDDMGFEVVQDIYYYDKHSHVKRMPKHKMVIGKIEMGFTLNEEEQE
ncbi:hypothetical protein HYW21_00515 [Candidatus Woesearchaeota archaeon]|nr:hypothetical protein [Candidatus Woesearchaeota archaeon]